MESVNKQRLTLRSNRDGEGERAHDRRWHLPFTESNLQNQACSAAVCQKNQIVSFIKRM